MEGLHHSLVIARVYRMRADADPADAGPRPEERLPHEGGVALCAPTLVAARISPADRPLAGVSLVGELDSPTMRRLCEQALALRRLHRCSVVIELCYVESPRAAALIAALKDLEAYDVRVVTTPLAPRAPSPTDDARRPRSTDPAPPPSPTPGRVASAADPFGLDRSFRALCLPPLRVLFERYFRAEVTGIEHVPASGPVLLAANHSGALPIDAAMLTVALDLHHPQHRCLRLLYERFVDDLPWIPRLYCRLGGVPASFGNAELLLRRGELVGLFPEGLAGAEKIWTKRYHLCPFRTGVARLSLRTGAPIIPVAIVGAEEAYPMIARSRLAGRLFGLPWLPITPLFPFLGLAGALPLPSRWHIHFCPPLQPPPVTDRRTEQTLARELTCQLRQTVDTALGELLARRRGAFL